MGTATRGMRPADIAEVVSIGDPRVSPDGATIAVVVTTVDAAANSYRSRIWLATADGSSAPRPFTKGGEARDRSPRWSPDGTAIAFVSHRDEKGSQILTIPVSAGGEAVTVASWAEEIEAVEWSPDGRHLAFIVRVPDPAMYGPGVDADNDRPPRRVTRFSNRRDSVGWTMDRPSRVFVVDPGGEQSPVEVPGPNPEGSDVAGLCWSPDSRRLAWGQGVAPDWDIDLRSPLVVAPRPGCPGETVVVAAGATLSRPAWAPDGTAIAVVSSDWFDPPRNSHIAIVDPDGDGDHQPAVLTGALDRNCAPSLANARGPQWVGERLWFQVEDQGAVHLYRVAVGGGDAAERMVAELMVGGDIAVSGFDVRDKTVAFTAVTPSSPGELFVLHDGAPRCLSAFGAGLAATVDLGRAERFAVSGADGEVIDAWYLPPTGTPRNATLLNIHGGPFAQYTGSFFEDFSVQAGAGYGVVWCNPRGSAGRSEAWGRAIRGPKCATEPGSGWGGVDADDLVAVVDAAIDRYRLDPTRIGVLGGSYGGYMTSWLVGHTDRFAAACSERAVNNQLTMVWTSDIGTSFQRGYGGVSHLEDPGEYLRMSPVTYASAIRTPLLILHSEADLRCPISQAEELWVALRLLGREVEFVRFPGSSHELSRSGPPRQRLSRSELILEFFDRHLPAPPS